MYTENSPTEIEHYANAEHYTVGKLITEYEAAEKEVADNPDDIAASIRLAAYATVLRIKQKRYFDRLC